MPRFSIKGLMLATALVAAGIVLLLLPQRLLYFGGLGRVVLSFISWLSGGAMIGAGLLTPLNKPWVGACLGMIALFLWLGIAAAWY